MRIALAAVLAFAGMWFIVLRPKPVDVSEPLPVVEAPAKPAAKAAKATPAASKPEAKAAATAKPKAKTKVAAKPKPVVTGEKAVLADLDAGRAVVLLFWDGKTTDDRYVRRAVSDVDRKGGKVRVHVAKLSQLAQYETITKAVPVTASPTVLVIGRDKKATAIRGLTVTAAVNDVAARALRAPAAK